MNKELQEYINQREKEIIKATIEFAKNNEIEYDQLTESMILNGMREISKQLADKLMGEMEELKKKVNDLTMDNMTHEYNQAEAERTWPHFKEQIELAFAKWLEENTIVIREDYPETGQIVLYKYANANYTLDDIYQEYLQEQNL